MSTYSTMATKNEERRTIKIKDSTYKGLRRLGNFGETFDDILQRMMKFEKQKVEKPAKYADKL